MMFWRMIGGKKKKKNSDEPSFYVQKRYDPESYLLNFDEGLGRVSKYNFYRSFSVRYD
ncbi:hypothetical protein F511_23679 [Dorcoceras hygrometricum]|uniref:Uncharacterized protein n=1 Tax=Dorcoceras hygrometricum TaxID=472368 RepID=A0A2Z7D2T4_9LAMI|nr:hypothetical protein F511_23679 [Dorcoceras hygrometricum]